jgi:hypothetical protein
MDELLAGVYGTGGFEKTASEGGPTTLLEIAQLFASEAVEDGDLEKVASARDEILEHLLSFDQAGRAIAQHEFTKMEKMAFAGDTSAIEAFFADVEADVEEPQHDDVQSAVLAEIERRLG